MTDTKHRGIGDGLTGTPALEAEMRDRLKAKDAEIAKLSEQLVNAETALKAAEYAARVNWEGWQQEIARNNPSAKTDEQGGEK